jgi:putative restriction endonuclease
VVCRQVGGVHVARTSFRFCCPFAARGAARQPVHSAPAPTYPFTRLRADGIWRLDHDVPDDSVARLTTQRVVGRFHPALEAALRRDPELVRTTARALVTSQFPDTVAPDVLAAVGLDPTGVLGSFAGTPDAGLTAAAAGQAPRRRDPRWRADVLAAWDRQCAFCGYDGQLVGASVGLDAAHVRWFAFDGLDDLDNGLALCVLHHKLFDLGVLGLDAAFRVLVSSTFSARTPAGRSVYDLHGHELRPRPGTVLPGRVHVAWHTREVFKGVPLAA